MLPCMVLLVILAVIGLYDNLLDSRRGYIQKHAHATSRLYTTSLIVRLHMCSIHKMQTIVAAVTLTVCWSRPSAVLKRLNRSTKCRLGCGLSEALCTIGCGPENGMDTLWGMRRLARGRRYSLAVTSDAASDYQSTVATSFNYWAMFILVISLHTNAWTSQCISIVSIEPISFCSCTQAVTRASSTLCRPPANDPNFTISRAIYDYL